MKLTQKQKAEVLNHYKHSKFLTTDKINNDVYMFGLYEAMHDKTPNPYSSTLTDALKNVILTDGETKKVHTFDLADKARQAFIERNKKRAQVVQSKDTQQRIKNILDYKHQQTARIFDTSTILKEDQFIIDLQDNFKLQEVKDTTQFGRTFTNDEMTVNLTLKDQVYVDVEFKNKPKQTFPNFLSKTKYLNDKKHAIEDLKEKHFGE